VKFLSAGFIATIKENKDIRNPAKSLKRWVASDIIARDPARYPQMNSIIMKVQHTVLIIFNLNIATLFSILSFSWNFELEKCFDKLIVGNFGLLLLFLVENKGEEGWVSNDPL
jgi:hypothetical protein